jgi:hypothetical protein
MRRRKFIALLSGAAVTWPLAARAQQPGEMRRIGVLMNLSENDPEAQRLVATFREGLAQLGWTDGRNLRIDYRWSGGMSTEFAYPQRNWSRSPLALSSPMAVRWWDLCNR